MILKMDFLKNSILLDFISRNNIENNNKKFVILHFHEQQNTLA